MFFALYGSSMILSGGGEGCLPHSQFISIHTPTLHGRAGHIDVHQLEFVCIPEIYIT